jgi:hypothetical protein
MLRLAMAIKFSGSDVRKPVQIGIQVSSSTVIDMRLVVSGDSKFLLTSHLNPDALADISLANSAFPVTGYVDRKCQKCCVIPCRLNCLQS